MASTPSKMVALGFPLPAFSLPDVVSGLTYSSSAMAGKPAVVFFICNHCPYVKRIRAGIAEFGRFCREHEVPLVAINANDAVAYPDDSPARMKDEAAEAGYVFPYLYDESQAVAQAFDARCTPDLFIFDAQGRLAYRGQFDDARPKNEAPVTGKDARAAVTALLAGKKPDEKQIASIGCNIKWKPGNEPVL
jgi:thiol-disulfide isomerase/thioredoxin